MKKSNWKIYAFWIGLAEAVGLLSGWLTFAAYLNWGVFSPEPIGKPPVETHRR